MKIKKNSREFSRNENLAGLCDDGEVDDNNCEDEDDTPPKLTAQAQGELSDGAYSPRGADTPTQDLISQIERHCDGYGEKNTDQDSFIHAAGIYQ